MVFITSLLFYLVLTAGSGNIYLWDAGEIVFGIIAAFVTSAIMSSVATEKTDIKKIFNPFRWLAAIGFMFVFLFSLAKANFDVAYRVITGKIKPGIVKIETGFKTDIATTMLSNAITLTPGTLTVDINEKTNCLYVHWINVKNKKPKPDEVIGSLMKWTRRIAE